MSTKNLKKFVGEYAYNIIKNITVDYDAIHKALVTPQNARNVFCELDEFEIKTLCAEISNDGSIGKIRETQQEEIIKAFNITGYDKIIFDDETEITECEKYYKQNEVICTYKDLQGRMEEYHMIVAIKKDIEKIKRATNPQREDEYGTSILNIQIAKNGSHMSIKNRYNHTVSQPDSTLNNNLDTLYNGLQSMVLGYYGFASLNSQKSHFSHIVNIGGVYLKYHTEQSNIYFGEFVLDSTNGVRFTDTSRYYIPVPDSFNKYFYTPIVLDFQDKIAIDITRHDRMSNGRFNLITKAMQDGILSSANKQDTDTLSMIFPNAKKYLLQCRNKALKYIHDMYGYDFTKPYEVTGFLGKFTAKSIEKATNTNNGILLVYVRNVLKVCELNNGKFNAKDVKYIYGYNIDTFCTQGRFEEVRKNEIVAMYFMHQDKEYIGSPKKEEKRIFYSSYGHPEFDKSGCDITEARYNLNEKLRKHKKEKLAKEVSKIDYSKDIEKIEESFASFKSDTIKFFTEAETYEDYKRISEALSYNLSWLVRDIIEFKKSAIAKSFTSVSNAQDNINKINSTIEKLNLKLKGGE